MLLNNIQDIKMSKSRLMFEVISSDFKVLAWITWEGHLVASYLLTSRYYAISAISQNLPLHGSIIIHQMTFAYYSQKQKAYHFLDHFLIKFYKTDFSIFKKKSPNIYRLAKCFNNNMRFTTKMFLMTPIHIDIIVLLINVLIEAILSE